MAANKVIVYLFAVLVPLSLVCCQESQDPNNSEGPPKPDHEDHDHHDRLFFSRVTPCNYATEGGLTCRSCNQALTCLSSNVGLIRTCRGFFRFCNQGRCSLTQGYACNPTTTASTSSTSTSSTSSTSSSTSSSTTSTTTAAPGGK